MAKKREFASDSDVSIFISRKKTKAESAEKTTKQQFSIYPEKGELEQVKILAKLKDVNLNTMFLTLIREALSKEEYQKMILAYQQMKELVL